MANTRIRYETYHDAQCDRLFNPPPLDESGPTFTGLDIDEMEFREQYEYFRDRDASNDGIDWEWWILMGLICLVTYFSWRLWW